MSIKDLRAEAWLAMKLGDPALYCGNTSRKERAQRARRRIRERGAENATVARRDGREISYAEAFEAIFGESLGDAA